MRIGIDARFYGPKTGGGGLGRYVSELITHLQEMDHEHEFVLFLKKENFHECVITNPRFSKQLVDVHWYSLKEQWLLPKAIKLAQVDFMHYPHWNIPFFSRIPFIVTIHDLILLQQRRSARSTRHPLIHGFKYAAFRTVLEKAVHKSLHILTISDFTKYALLQHFALSPKQISVIKNGIQLAKPDTGLSLTPYGIYEPYILFVGNAYPHKNIDTLIEAFHTVVKKIPYVQLVIAGKRDIFSKQLEEEAYRIGLTNEQIRFVDTPSDELIATLYQRANLFVFPSKVEGFGIPPLEAMSYGTPVISSSADPMPEILEEAALFFEPDDPTELTERILQVLEHPKQTAALIEKGYLQAEKYNWQHVAIKTKQIYDHIAKTLS